MTSVADERLGNIEWADNWTIGPGLRVEIMELATRDVWLCQEPVHQDIVASLDVPEGHVIALAAPAVADIAYFDRSPDAEANGPLDVREISGLRFARVARPVDRETLDGGTTRLSVHKHHTMLYRAGRTIDVLDVDDGSFLTLAWSGSGKVERRLPEGWSIRAVELTADLIARVPDPATVAVLNDGSGFHGPIPAAVIEEASMTEEESS